MKKGGTALLVLTVLFVGFIAGILVGRTINDDKTTIQILPEQTPVMTVSQDLTPTVGSQQRININTATASMLDSLPGIGPVLAQRIIDYRTEFGPFTKTTDISNIEGIGPEKLLTILDLITVEE